MGEGKILGEIALVYNTQPLESVETKSYCSIVKINNHAFNEMLVHYPHIKTRIINQIINNPYDLERDFFIKKCRQHIPYFKSLDDDTLKELYY